MGGLALFADSLADPWTPEKAIKIEPQKSLNRKYAFYWRPFFFSTLRHYHSDGGGFQVYVWLEQIYIANM